MESYQKHLELDHSHNFTMAQDYPKIMLKRALLKVLITMQVMFQMALIFYACLFSSPLGPPPFVTAIPVLLCLIFSLSGALALKWYNLDILKFYGTVAHQVTMIDMVIFTSFRSEFKSEQAKKGIQLETSWMGIKTVDVYWYYFMLLGTIMAVSQPLITHFLIRDLKTVHDEENSNGKQESA